MRELAKIVALIAGGAVAGAGLAARWCYKNQVKLALLHNLRRER